MNAPETVQNPPAPVEQVVRELRTIRGYALKCAGALDAAGRTEAVHSLRMALCSLDDCLTEIEKPEPPTQVFGDLIYSRQDTIADEIEMDRQMDADRSESL